MQTRRTDDPSEKDRSESYSVKQPKTYTWKAENIRTGKLPQKPEQPKAKAPEAKEPGTSAPDLPLFYGLTWDDLMEVAMQNAPAGAWWPTKDVA